tara:strand:+ start:684 stop:1487 length:804 start_codon:yes stop_codon:yes gene_type:complete
MKVTIMTSHFTEWNMYIDSCHLIFSFVQIQKKSIYDYNSILLSVFLISLVLTYYKINYPLFFKRYFNIKNILFLGSKEDFFYRSQLSSMSNILPLIIYALVISFFSVYVFEDSNFIVLDSIGELNLFQKWIFFSLPLGLFIFFRILLIFIVTYLFNFSKKIKKIFILNFIRLTILLSFINILFSYILYELLSFEIAYNFFTAMKLFVIFIRPLILYNYMYKASSEKRSNLLLVILICDFIPSVLLFDIVSLVNFFDYLLAYLDFANF